MIHPIEIQLAHFKVDQIAQTTKSAIAAAQQTGQGKEIVEEGVKRAQMVQAGDAVAETGKVKRREEEEARERRREKQGQGKFFSTSSDDASGAAAEPAELGAEEIKVKKGAKSFELYA